MMRAKGARTGRSATHSVSQEEPPSSCSQHGSIPSDILVKSEEKGSPAGRQKHGSVSARGHGGPSPSRHRLVLERDEACELPSRGRGRATV